MRRRVRLTAHARVYPRFSTTSRTTRLHQVRALNPGIADRASDSFIHTVLRMLSHYVGEEKFLKGVSVYLNKHLYANSVTKDLWDGIAESSGMHSACTHSHNRLELNGGWQDWMFLRSWTTGSSK